MKNPRFPLYISTFDLTSQLSYSITIEASSELKCDSNCFYSGFCNEYGCSCYQYVVGSICNHYAVEIYASQEIYDSDEIYDSEQIELSLLNEPAFFYIQLNKYQDESLELNITTDSSNGILIYTQKSKAIFIPDSENFNQDLVQKNIVQYSKALCISIDVPKYENTRLVFAAISFNGTYNTIESHLFFQLRIATPEKEKSTDSVIIIIAIVVSIVAGILLTIGLCCMIKIIRRRNAVQIRQIFNQISSKKSTYSNLIIIQSVEVNPDEACTICLEKLVNGSELNQTPCKHNFHRECILAWTAKHQECPICRSSLIIKLY